MSNASHLAITDLAWQWDPDESQDFQLPATDDVEQDCVDYAVQIEALAKEREALQEAARKLKRRIEARKAAENHARGQLLERMRRVGLDKVKSPLVTISRKPTPPKLVPVDEQAIPKWLFRYKREVAKSKAKQHFESTGEIPPGFELQESAEAVQLRF